MFKSKSKPRPLHFTVENSWSRTSTRFVASSQSSHLSHCDPHHRRCPGRGQRGVLPLKKGWFDRGPAPKDQDAKGPRSAHGLNVREPASWVYWQCPRICTCNGQAFSSLLKLLFHDSWAKQNTFKQIKTSSAGHDHGQVKWHTVYGISPLFIWSTCQIYAQWLPCVLWALPRNPAFQEPHATAPAWPDCAKMLRLSELPSIYLPWPIRAITCRKTYKHGQNSIKYYHHITWFQLPNSWSKPS